MSVGDEPRQFDATAGRNFAGVGHFADVTVAR